MRGAETLEADDGAGEEEFESGEGRVRAFYLWAQGGCFALGRWR